MYPNIDRRKSERLHIQVATRYAWSQDRKRHRAAGITQNIGTHGMLVVSDQIPPTGVDVTFEVRLGGPHASPGLTVVGIGQVARTEILKNGMTGFVVTSRRRFQFKKVNPEVVMEPAEPVAGVAKFS